QAPHTPAASPFYFTHNPTLSLSFFYKHPATTHIYTLSLHDAPPIWPEAEEPNETTDRQDAGGRAPIAEPGGHGAPSIAIMVATAASSVQRIASRRSARHRGPRHRLLHDRQVDERGRDAEEHRQPPNRVIGAGAL